MAAAVAAPVDDVPSSSAKSLYAADIYAVQHRLHRCLQTVAPLLSSTGAAECASTARHTRRLGDLLREATALCARMDGPHAESDSLVSSHPTAATEDAGITTADEPLRAFYDQQLHACFSQLQADMVNASNLLRTFLNATRGLRGLPVSCIGTTPRQLQLNLVDFPAETCYVFSDALTPAAARLPPPVHHCIPDEAEAGQPFLPPTTAERSPQQGSSSGRAQAAEATPSAPPQQQQQQPASAEDRIMSDIQQAIHQMKDGALQMSAMMAQERTQMQSAADLLSSGVAKSQVNLKELERVSYVAASGKVPWLLSFIPMMPILWRTVLQPMWAFFKQVLLMVAIVVVTGCVLMIIAALPKPVLFRGQRKASAASPALPQPSPLPTAVSASTHDSPPPSQPAVTHPVPHASVPQHTSPPSSFIPDPVPEQNAWTEPDAPADAVQRQQPEEQNAWAEPDSPVDIGQDAEIEEDVTVVAPDGAEDEALNDEDL